MKRRGAEPDSPAARSSFSEASMQHGTDRNSAERHGADAASPVQLPARAWWVILKRVWVNIGRRNVGLMSAGVAFYAFLSFVPLLGALLMSYGLIADPATVADHMKMIIALVPADAARLIYEQLTNLTTAAADKKGLGLLVALAVSVYGATRASGALITALNVIYGEEDHRGLIRGTATSAVLIVGAILIGIVGVLSASMLGYAQDLIRGIGPVAAGVIRVATWLAAGALCCTTMAAMYRFAPDRADARWSWLSVGSVLATLLWLAATLGFGFYAARFGDYDVTYGSLGAVVVLLMWLYVSAYATLLGAMVNAEAERQTARDTTTGSERPMGRRGAVVADMSAALDAAATST
jgi:membrane protein